MAAYIFHRLIMVKKKIDNFCLSQWEFIFTEMIIK